MNTPWWDLLGIPRDSDRAAKRRAYAAKLKVTNPEDDPKGFMALRQAYETALNWVEWDDDWEAEDWDEGAADESSAPAARQPFEPGPVVAEPEPVVELAPEPPVIAVPAVPVEPLHEPVVAQTVEPEPEPVADPHAGERNELRQLTAALEAGLRGPWFKGETELKFCLGRILESPALIDLDTRDRLEFWLAELLADTVPRSDRLLLKAIQSFGWDQEGEKPPAVWRILGRIDEWRLMHSLNLGEHELSDGWQALTREGGADWKRRLLALRPGVVLQVRRLLDLGDYQTPGIVHSMDPHAVAWWRAHLGEARFGFIDLAVIAFALAVLLPIAILANDAASRWVAAGAVLAGTSFPAIRLYWVAPWRARRDAEYLPAGWFSHGWLVPWAGAAMLLLWAPANGPAGGLSAALSGVAALWMAATVGREPQIGNVVWPLVSFGALALVGGLAFLSLSGSEQLALVAFGIGSLVIAGCGGHAIAELLWRVGEKPVLAASALAVLLVGAAITRSSLPMPPAPLVPWGAATIAGMTLLYAVRELHDGSFVVRFAPLLRWVLWIVLIGAAIASTPPAAPGNAPPVMLGVSDPMKRLEQSEPGFGRLRLANPTLHGKIAAVAERQRKGEIDAEAAMQSIDGLVNAAYRQRLPFAPAALIAAETDIQLATLRERAAPNPGGCATSAAAAAFTPSEALRKRHYAHALAVAAATPALSTIVRPSPAIDIYKLAAKGDETRAAALAKAIAGGDPKAECAARIAVLEAISAQSDADVANMMRPGLIARAAAKTTKN